MTDSTSEGTFSIYSSVISHQHRAFYEKIVSELNGIFPICNQGKCKAVEISEDTTEQEQITDLMQRVENFSGELHSVTKKLFDQFYQAKEDFCKSIYSTTAYVKINLMDRNLLERTCDVRWWALETAFGQCVSQVSMVREQLQAMRRSLLEQMSDDVPPCDEMLELATLLEQEILLLLDSTRRERFTDLLLRLRKKSSRVGRKADQTESSWEPMQFDQLPELLGRSQKLIDHACSRLEDINASYTLYRDLVITTKDGYVIANSNREARQRVLGMCVAGEDWFQRAMATKDSNSYIAQDLSPSALEDMLSLVYATAIRKDSHAGGDALGAMGVFFDFQGEARMILEDYLPLDEQNLPREGWYSFFSNEAGEIIASNDPMVLTPGDSAHLPRRHRHLRAGERAYNYGVFEGESSAILSAKTDGYLEYEGLGWTSHLIVPRKAMFQLDNGANQIELPIEELMHSRLIPEINKLTYERIQDDKESIQLISLNGIVFASKLGKRGVALGPIFDQITTTGDFATSRMEQLLAEMALGEVNLILQSLEHFSKQAIDLIDRNLFERSADIRWWSTDEYFWRALESPSTETFEQACKRLKVINNSYTMYRNLVLADLNGDIVACSRTELRNELRKINVSEELWYQRGLQTTQSTEYAVQDVSKSPVERQKDVSLIYAGGVRRTGSRNGESIGVLGVMFDWDTEAQKILRTCLPRDNSGNCIEGSAACYTNSEGIIIETTLPEVFSVGKQLNLPTGHTGLKRGESCTGLILVDGVKYIVGSSRTKGYREYAGLGWSAHVLRPVH
jgi:hypothetical protein